MQLPPSQAQIDQFIADLGRDDLMAVVIRGHLHIEAGIHELLAGKLALPTEIIKEYIESMRFDRKVKLAIDLALLPGDSKPALTELHKLRNKFAHNLTYEVGQSDVDQLRKVMSPRLGQAVDPLKGSIREQLVRCIAGLHVQVSEAVQQQVFRRIATNSEGW